MIDGASMQSWRVIAPVIYAVIRPVGSLIVQLIEPL